MKKEIIQLNIVGFSGHLAVTREPIGGVDDWHYWNLDYKANKAIYSSPANGHEPKWDEDQVSQFEELYTYQLAII